MGPATEELSDGRLRVLTIQENLRYDKVAEALGGYEEYVTKPSDFKPALERAYAVAVKESRPSAINCQGKKEFWDRQKTNRQHHYSGDTTQPAAEGTN